MKATLLLVVCLAGVTVQQNLFWPFPSQARFQYLPQLMDRRFDQQEPVINQGKAQEREGKEAASYFFSNARYLPPYNPVYYYYNNEPQQLVSPAEQESFSSDEDKVQSRSGGPVARFFFPGLLGGFGNFGGFGLMSTTYSFASTVLTVTSTKFCTESSAFNATLSCRRRREALWELLEAPERIEPTQAIAVQPTAVAKEFTQTAEQFEISGSLEQEVEQPSARKARTFATVRTVTVTTIGSTTATATVTSTIRSSAILLPGSKLQCLPVGASIC